MLSFHILFAVWGDPYIDSMVKITIPTLLFDANIHALAARHDCKVIFFTRRGDEAKIRSAASVVRLAEIVRIEFVLFDPDSAPHPYIAMSQAHILGGVAAQRAGARVIVAAPDLVFANGALAHVGKLAEQGKSAVMYPALRIVEETATEILQRRIETGANPISGRELVKITLDNLHPLVKPAFYDSKKFTEWPAVCCWSVKDNGLLARCFHPHPFMIDFSRVVDMSILKTQAIDGVFLPRALPDWSDVHMETDSDNIHLCSLTPRDMFGSFSMPGSRSASVWKLQRFAYCHPNFVSPLHRSFFTKAVKMHVDDLDDAWRRREVETAAIAEAMLQPPTPLAMRAGRALNQMARVKNGVARRIWAYAKPLRSRRSTVSSS